MSWGLISATGHVAIHRQSGGPNRYLHNFHPKNPTRMKDFLVELLDLRVSDIIANDHAYFLRCNTEHQRHRDHPADREPSTTTSGRHRT